MPKSMFHSWWIFFGWSQIPSFCSETYKMMSSVQPLWQESKRTWKRWSYFDWIWHDALVEYRGATGLEIAMFPRRPWFDFYGGQRVAQVVPFHDMYTVYRIPTGISPHENLKHHTLEPISLDRILSHGWGVSFVHPKNPRFFFWGAKQVRKPESLVARAGSLVICSCFFFFGRGPPPEKEKGKHRSPKHQCSNFLGPSR